MQETLQFYSPTASPKNWSVFVDFETMKNVLIVNYRSITMSCRLFRKFHFVLLFSREIFLNVKLLFRDFLTLKRSLWHWKIPRCYLIRRINKLILKFRIRYYNIDIMTGAKRLSYSIPIFVNKIIRSSFNLCFKDFKSFIMQNFLIIFNKFYKAFF